MEGDDEEVVIRDPIWECPWNANYLLCFVNQTVRRAASSFAPSGKMLTGRKERGPLPKVSKQRFIDVAAKSQELLPGIPDDITLDQITTKLPWGASHVLSCVSRGWQQAIQRNHVYEARVRSHSTETLVVCRDTLSGTYAPGPEGIVLYSSRDERFYDPPPIPHLGGIRRSCQCISLGGQLYVLGGVKNYKTHLSSKEVYVFDLAGERQWRRCASMQFPRQEFGCGVLEGKIYVFGGTSRWKPVSQSEVYDPKEDTWSPLPPMPTLRTRFNHRVVTVGEELIIHGGQVFHTGYEAWIGDRVRVDEFGFTEARGHVGEWCEDEKSVDAYHPVKKQWRVVTPNTLWWPHMEVVPLAAGKFCSMDLGKAYVHDLNDRDLATHLHSFSSVDMLRRSFSSKPVRIVVVDGELLATVRLSAVRPLEEGMRFPFASRKSCLVRSKGFSSKNFEIAWEKVPPNEKNESLEGIQIVCTIQL